MLRKAHGVWRAHRGYAAFLCALASLAASASVAAQQPDRKSAQVSSSISATAPPPALTRATTRHETRRFGYGGTLTILGAPAGSITIEAWPRAEVDITADIELRADTEADLTRLAALNSFLLDEDVNHLRLITTGTHDKAFMRRAAKNFPKKLLSLPWKIDYRIRVPASIDLEIDTGRGPVSLNGVDGAIKLNALESNAALMLTGGQFSATIGGGDVNVKLATRSWRGAGVDVRLATGALTVELPARFSGDLDADVLRTGHIENEYAALLPRERTTPTARSIKLRAGAGGATLAFTVGDGRLRIKPQDKE